MTKYTSHEIYFNDSSKFVHRFYNYGSIYVFMSWGSWRKLDDDKIVVTNSCEEPFTQHIDVEEDITNNIEDTYINVEIDSNEYIDIIEYGYLVNSNEIVKQDNPYYYQKKETLDSFQIRVVTRRDGIPTIGSLYQVGYSEKYYKRTKQANTFKVKMSLQNIQNFCEEGYIDTLIIKDDKIWWPRRKATFVKRIVY